MSGLEAVGSTRCAIVSEPEPVAVEQLKTDERVWAGERNPVEQRLFEALAALPSPGAMELEVEGLVSNTGGRLSVNVSRALNGAFEVRLAGEGQWGLRVGAGGFVGGGVAATWTVQTPEAAAELVQSGVLLLATGQFAGRLAPASEVLESLELRGHFAAGLKTELPIVLGELSFMGEARGVLDFEHHVLRVERGVRLDATARGGAIIAAAGLEGVVSAKLISEVELSSVMPPRPRRLVLEGEARSEVHALFGAGHAELTKLEVQVDLALLAQHPDEPRRAMSGTRRTFVASGTPLGTGLELPQLSFKARAASFTVIETPLFDEAPCLLQELDRRRLSSLQDRRIR